MRSVWSNMGQLQQEMDHLLGGTRGPVRVKYPALNVWFGDEGLIVTAEIPGVDPDSIQVTIHDQTLTLSGSRLIEDLPEGATYRRRERGTGDFSRIVELPIKVDSDNVEAKFQNGVLQLKLPRIAEEKPKQIIVKSS